MHHPNFISSEVQTTNHPVNSGSGLTYGSVGNSASMNASGTVRASVSTHDPAYIIGQNGVSHSVVNVSPVSNASKPKKRGKNQNVGGPDKPKRSKSTPKHTAAAIATPVASPGFVIPGTVEQLNFIFGFEKKVRDAFSTQHLNPKEKLFFESLVQEIHQLRLMMESHNIHTHPEFQAKMSQILAKIRSLGTAARGHREPNSYPPPSDPVVSSREQLGATVNSMTQIPQLTASNTNRSMRSAAGSKLDGNSMVSRGSILALKRSISLISNEALANSSKCIQEILDFFDNPASKHVVSIKKETEVHSNSTGMSESSSVRSSGTNNLPRTQVNSIQKSPSQKIHIASGIVPSSPMARVNTPIYRHQQPPAVHPATDIATIARASQNVQNIPAMQLSQGLSQHSVQMNHSQLLQWQQQAIGPAAGLSRVPVALQNQNAVGSSLNASNLSHAKPTNPSRRVSSSVNSAMSPNAASTQLAHSQPSPLTVTTSPMKYSLEQELSAVQDSGYFKISPVPASNSRWALYMFTFLKDGTPSLLVGIRDDYERMESQVHDMIDYRVQKGRTNWKDEDIAILQTQLKKVMDSEQPSVYNLINLWLRVVHTLIPNLADPS